MPKPHTFPYIIDEEDHISISKLREWKYLLPGSWKMGTITWSRNGIEISSIGIEVIFKDHRKEVWVSYRTRDKEDHRYKISLVSLPSNLGKGKVWYFRCPFTGVRCRKLHFINRKFMHRSALNHGMYSKQVYSKKWRNIEKVYCNYFDHEKALQELNSKHFTKYYNGKPTKKYLKLKARIEDAERFSPYEIERLFLM